MLDGMTVEQKTRENRIRQALARQGYRLHKIRRIDPLAVDYGHYRITDPTTDTVVADLPNLDAAEAWARKGH